MAESNLRSRRSIRLPGWEYAADGAYFVTLCTRHHALLFGEIVGETMHLNALGQIVQEEWLKSAQIRQEITLDWFVIMPNHMHAIVFISGNDDRSMRKGDRPVAPTEGNWDPSDPVARTNTPSTHGNRTPNPDPLGNIRAPARGPEPRSLSSLIGGFKAAATTRINRLRETPSEKVWQRNYYEHVIRNDADYARIAGYIHANPAQWAADRYYRTIGGV